MVENVEISQEKFDEQTFLIHNFNQFVTSNEKIKYKNFVPLTDEPSVLLSKLLGTGIGEFFKIKPDQLSLLQPKIRLYKTIYSTKTNQEIDVELIFNDFFRESTVDDILKNSGQRGFGIALKSFEWEDLGTNPGDTGKAFQSTLIIHTQSLIDLFKEQRDQLTGEIASFADLIRTAPNKFNKNGSYNDQYFRIKIQIGWQVPSDTVSMIDDKLRKDIEASNVTLFLTLTDHTIDLKNDGTATITANYIGAIEGKFLSSSTDVLYIDKNIQKNIELQEKLLASAKQRKDKLKESNDKKGRSNFIGRSLEAFGFGRSGDELEEIGLETEIQERLEAKENIERENKALSYKRLLTSLEKKGRIYFVDIDKEDVRKFQNIRQELIDLGNVEPDQLEKVKAQKLQKIRLESKSTRFDVGSYKNIDPSNPVGFETLKNALEQETKHKDEKDREKIRDEANKRLTEAKQAKGSNKTRINFIYFGDLVEAALSVVRGDDDKVLENDSEKKDIRDNFRVLLGPLELVDFKTQESHIKNLADIPISIDLFNAWFLKKVIRPQLDKYLLRDFLKDVCSELVVKAISSDPTNIYNQSTRNRISFSVFSLGSSDGDPFAPNGTFGNIRLNLKDLEQREGTLASMRSSTDASKMKHYLMLYISSYNPHSLKGEYETDTKKGLYHFQFGVDRGIVKNISFNKTNLQYQKEARIVNQTQFKKGDVYFMEPYNAKVDLYGTSVFKPGMMVYINHNSIGMFKSIPKQKRIPLGGYYTIIKVFGKIEPGKFETILDLQWESSGEEDDNTQVIKNDKTNNISIDQRMVN